MNAEKHLGSQEVSHESQCDGGSDGWDALVANGKERKDAILLEHFRRAFERFRAGVSLAKIRENYERLGAKYSPATFRKKWDALVKAHELHR